MLFSFFNFAQVFTEAGGYSGGTTNGGSSGGGSVGHTSKYFRSSLRNDTSGPSTPEGYVFMGVSLGVIVAFLYLKRKRRKNVTDELLSRLLGTTKEKITSRNRKYLF
ncbi:TPA: hypothetical protein ACIECC_000345 [Enterococcus faecium]